MHAELVKQYESEKITAREFVEAVWDLTACCDGSYRDYPRGTVLVQPTHGRWDAFRGWEDAAEFTLNRIEEVRQVDEEIHDLESFASMESWKITGWFEFGSSPSEDGMVQIVVKSYVRKMRTLVRLQEKRAELTRGMDEAPDE